VASPLDKLFAERDDWELVKGLSSMINQPHMVRDAIGWDLPHGWIDRLKPDEKVVELVVYSEGIMDNGGFQYFYEGDTALYAKEIAEAYDTIGLPDAARCVREVLALFPRRERHTVEEWNRDFAYVKAENPDRVKQLDSRFLRAAKPAIRHLAAWARQNRHAFEHLG
jgi:hypothetical protein